MCEGAIEEAARSACLIHALPLVGIAKHGRRVSMLAYEQACNRLLWEVEPNRKYDSVMASGLADLRSVLNGVVQVASQLTRRRSVRGLV